MSFRSNAIWEAIESQNYKLAHQHIAKALRRNPKDEYTQALKAYVYSLQRKPEDALTIARQLADTVPSSNDTLDLLYGIMLDSSGATEAGMLYERAAKKYPKSEKILTSWFWATSTGLDVRGQQKAAMALQKSFGSNRDYTLWCATSCFLAALEADATEMEKMLFSGLARRMIALVGESQTAEEAVIKARILQVVGAPARDELLKFLTDDATEKWNNLELAVMRLEVAVESENWDVVFKVAKKTLVDECRDDYESWKQMAVAVKKLGDAALVNEYEGLLAEKQGTRNGALAAVFYASLAGDVTEQAQTYFTKFGRKQCAFEDLKPFIDLVDSEKWLAFLDSQVAPFSDALGHATYDQLNVIVNARKFVYILRPATDSYVLENIKLYNALLPTLKTKEDTEYFAGDDLLLLAVQWILDARPTPFEITKQDVVMSLVVLLESAAGRDKHQFYVRLWLVRLYLYIGCFQQASGHYSSLSIKNIQLDMLSHHLLTRLSTLSPVFKTMIATREIYDMNAVQTPKYVKASYEAGSYSQVQGIKDFAKRLTNSVGKGVLCVEAKRIGRLSGAKMDGLGINPQMIDMKWCDNRDFEVLGGVRKVGESAVEEKYRIGPRQGANWIEAFMLKETIVELWANAKSREGYASRLEALLKSEGLASEVTKAEKWSLEVVLQLAQVATSMTQATVTKLQTLLDAGISEFGGTSESQVDWSWIHDRFIIFETIKIVIPSLDFLSSTTSGARGGKLGTLISAIKKTCVAKAETIKESAKEIKNGRDKWVRETAERLSSYATITALDTSNIDIEAIVEGIGKSQDEALTMLRMLKV
ncbi:N-acetyltransferase B complex non catalytic subunit-domain-containing protein [Myxozyma melibiosi]|uniref:N-acetyltransferase B complex non catalytic subunit-domain-containing protein n=1 Tax=Myxozyma melibiosi TaxID=54550 RepID=A0ABR1F3N5_9ASCO